MLQVVDAEAEQGSELRELVRDESSEAPLFVEARGQIGVRRCDDRAFALLGEDDALALQFEIGALDGDDADAEGDSQLADGGNFVSGRPLANRDALADLLHDLEIHGAAVGL